MKFLLTLGLLLASNVANAALLTTNDTYLLDHMNETAYKTSLGTHIKNLEAGGSNTLANGKINIGNASNVSTAVTLSGDVTTTNAGVTAIGANKVLETMLARPVAGDTGGLSAHRIAKAVWDPSGVAGMRTVNPHGLGVFIPATSLVTRAYFYTKTAVVSTGNNGTIAFSCQSANDLFSAADIDSSTGLIGGIGTGVPTGSGATGMFITTSACEITATVAVNAFTAGKIDFFVEYVTAE